MTFGKVNSQQPVEIMSLKLSEDATTIVAILFLVYSVSIHQPFLGRSPSRFKFQEFKFQVLLCKMSQGYAMLVVRKS